jgi:hypothetical protein
MLWKTSAILDMKDDVVGGDGMGGNFKSERVDISKSFIETKKRPVLYQLNQNW